MRERRTSGGNAQRPPRSASNGSACFTGSKIRFNKALLEHAAFL